MNQHFLVNLLICFLIMALAAFLVGVAAGAIQGYQEKKAIKRRWDRRAKGTIAKVGTAHYDQAGAFHAHDWVIHCPHRIPPNCLDPFTHELVIGGYSERELIEISKRRADWQ